VKITIELTDEEAEQLTKLADITEQELTDFIEAEVIPQYLQMMEVGSGNIGELLASAIYDDLEEAKRAATKADALEGRKHDWLFYKRPDGRISSECSPCFHKDRIKEGCELIEEVPA